MKSLHRFVLNISENTLVALQSVDIQYGVPQVKT